MEEATASTSEELIAKRSTHRRESRPPSYSQIFCWNTTLPSLSAPRSPSNLYLLQQEEPAHIPDYTPLSLFTTIFCCLILGIAAMIPASEANNLKSIDPRKAKEQADMSRNLNIFGIGCGIIAYTVLIVQFGIMKKTAL